MSISTIVSWMEKVSSQATRKSFVLDKKQLEEFRDLLGRLRGMGATGDEQTRMYRCFKALVIRAKESRSRCYLPFLLILCIIHPIMSSVCKQMLLHWPTVITISPKAFHVQSVRDMLLDSGSSSCSSWISTRCLLNLAQDYSHLKSLNQLWNSDLQFKANVISVFKRNRHFTNCNYLAELLQVLENDTHSQRGRTRRNTHLPDIFFIPKCGAGDFQVFDYLRKKTPTFKNLYQLESFKCEELGLHVSFNMDHIILAQICRNTLVVWISNESSLDPLFLNLTNMESVKLGVDEIEMNMKYKSDSKVFSGFWKSESIKATSLKFRLRRSYLLADFAKHLELDTQMENRLKIFEVEQHLAFPAKGIIRSKIEVGRSDNDPSSGDIKGGQWIADVPSPPYNHVGDQSRVNVSHDHDEIIFSSPLFMQDKTPNRHEKSPIRNQIQDDESKAIEAKNDKERQNDKLSQNIEKDNIFTPNKLLTTLERASKFYGKKQPPKSSKKDIWDLSSSIPSSPSKSSPNDKIMTNKASASLVENSQFDPSPLDVSRISVNPDRLGASTTERNQSRHDSSDNEDIQINTKRRRVMNVLESTYPSASYGKSQSIISTKAKNATQDTIDKTPQSKSSSAGNSPDYHSESTKLSDDFIGNSTILENKANNETNNTTSNLLVDNASKVGVSILNHETSDSKIRNTFNMVEESLNFFCAEHLHRLDSLHQMFLSKEKEILAKYERKLQLLEKDHDRRNDTS